MQIGFYFNQKRCTGCGTCGVACKDWHDIPAGPVNWMRVKYSEKGKYPQPFVSYLIAPCYQCADPVCLAACPVKAISKRAEDGIVVVDTKACLGKQKCNVKCLKACPYQSPQFGPEPDARMSKCNFCLDRWEEKKMPVCVEACPTRALDAGPLEYLKQKYGDLIEADGFKYHKKARPSVIFNPKKWEPQK